MLRLFKYYIKLQKMIYNDAVYFISMACYNEGVYTNHWRDFERFDHTFAMNMRLAIDRINEFKRKAERYDSLLKSTEELREKARKYDELMTSSDSI